MKRYEYLSHTADAKFKAYGKTDEEKFENCALAMFGIITNPENVKETETHELELEAKSLRGLLYDFLDELLYLHETKDFVLSKVKEINIQKLEGKYSIKVKVTGDTYKNYELSGHVKAITYNDFEYTEDYVMMVMDL
jgi:SHS2 domain-containing protein